MDLTDQAGHNQTDRNLFGPDTLEAPDFYARNTEVVARDLLGTILVRTIGEEVLAARIVETEAYTQDDPASHSYRGLTRRNTAMFGPPGHAYVYFIYGMYHCFNVVTEPTGRGAAVLIRAVEPIIGIESMRRNRRLEDRGTARPRELAGGPGRLCAALGITLEENGVALFETDGPLAVHRDRDIENSAPADTRSNREIAVDTRVGISRGTEQLRRYYFSDSACISRRSRKNGV